MAPKLTETEEQEPSSLDDSTLLPDPDEVQGSSGTFTIAATSNTSDAAMGPDDSQLIAEVLRGNPESFGALVERHQGRLFRTLTTWMGHAGDAQDVCQEAFVLAYQRLDRFRGEASFFSWLCRIGINCAISARRKRRVSTVPLTVGDGEGEWGVADAHAASRPEHRLELQDRKKLVQQALDSLAPEFRVCLVLKDVEELSYEEIAATVDCPVGTVRSRIHRARQELREKLRILLRDEQD